eukprot:TRINITY_DN2820_c1_g1_i1.p1 TRINITY_DN2820_c1_g1~~TRINITY_DN2820_c1_g1_i1.p1  ORF type:complete len:319 (+),score=48.41 TRINITY_DN2820_c1_g1_i1:330-1286(+)
MSGQDNAAPLRRPSTSAPSSPAHSHIKNPPAQHEESYSEGRSIPEYPDTTSRLDVLESPHMLHPHSAHIPRSSYSPHPSISHHHSPSWSAPRQEGALPSISTMFPSFFPHSALHPSSSLPPHSGSPLPHSQSITRAFPGSKHPPYPPYTASAPSSPYISPSPSRSSTHLSPNLENFHSGDSSSHHLQHQFTPQYYSTGGLPPLAPPLSLSDGGYPPVPSSPSLSPRSPTSPLSSPKLSNIASSSVESGARDFSSLDASSAHTSSKFTTCNLGDACMLCARGPPHCETVPNPPRSAILQGVLLPVLHTQRRYHHPSSPT